MKRPETPPEGALIAAALERSELSQRRAAEAAGMSAARWRQIAAGYQSVGGTRVPVVAPAETLARMARAVAVTAEQLEEAGRADAAQELRSLLEAESADEGDSSAAADPHVQAIAAMLATLPPEAQDEVLRLYQVQRKQAHPTPQRHVG